MTNFSSDLQLKFIANPSQPQKYGVAVSYQALLAKIGYKTHGLRSFLRSNSLVFFTKDSKENSNSA